MFINWKIIITLVIVLVVLVIFLGSNPTVSNFFSSITQRVGNAVNIETEVSRPVKFSLILDNYGPITFSNRHDINISITGSTAASLREGLIRVNKTLDIINYDGSGSIENDILKLDGSFEKIEWPEISIFLNGPIKLNSSYSVLMMYNLALKSLGTNASGILAVGDTETRFTGEITAAEPLGKFVFDRVNGTQLTITGMAKSISIPSAGINVK